MKKNLEDIREKLEIEIDVANALAEIMLLIRTGSYSFDKNEITFEDVKNAFWLTAEISEKHARDLDTIANELIDFYNDTRNK